MPHEASHEPVKDILHSEQEHRTAEARAVLLGSAVSPNNGACPRHNWLHLAWTNHLKMSLASKQPISAKTTPTIITFYIVVVFDRFQKWWFTLLVLAVVKSL